jgi:hypothetical protein
MRGGLPPLSHNSSWRCAYLSIGKTLPLQVIISDFIYALRFYVRGLSTLCSHMDIRMPNDDAV